MSVAGKLEETSNLSCKGSYDRKLTVLYTVQKVFDKGKAEKTIFLNSRYSVLFRNPRDEVEMRSLPQQLFPSKVKSFMDSFREATKKDHAYLRLGLHPLTPNPVRVRTSIFKSDEEVIFAPASESSKGRYYLDPSRYIKSLD